MVSFHIDVPLSILRDFNIYPARRVPFFPSFVKHFFTVYWLLGRGLYIRSSETCTSHQADLFHNVLRLQHNLNYMYTVNQHLHYRLHKLIQWSRLHTPVAFQIGTNALLLFTPTSETNQKVYKMLKHVYKMLDGDYGLDGGRKWK